MSIQQTSQLIQRIEGESDLYSATHDANRLHAAQTAAIRLETYALHLKNTVADNGLQIANVQQLTECVSGLTDGLGASMTSDPVKAQALKCQQTLSLMAEQERELLKQRNSDCDGACFH